MGSTSTRLVMGGVALFVLLSLASLSTSTAAAQSAQQVVESLNGDAMEAYNNLEIDKAGSMLEEALRVAFEGGVGGPLLARTNLNLGIIYIGGLGDSDSGLKYFTQAVCVDPSIQLDPLTSTPEISGVFEIAQQNAKAGACAGGPASAGSAPAPGYTPPPPPPPDQAFLHVAPMEQAAQTPLPIYAEINPLAQAKEAFLFYRGLGMESFKRVPMYRLQGGLAYQISCNDVWEPKVEYYIEAHDQSGNVVGSAGSAAAPIQVAVVSAPSQAPPAFPGAQAPGSCAAKECPPGMKGCDKLGRAAIGDGCGGDGECQDGLECRGGSCMIAGAGGTEIPDYDPMTGGFADVEDEEPDDPSQFQRFFVQAGFVVGMAYLTRGMVADRPSPDPLVFVDQFGEFVPDPWSALADADASNDMIFFPKPGADSLTADKVTAWEPDADSADSLRPIEGDCSADGVLTGPADYAATKTAENPVGNPDVLFPSKYCVRVKSPGFAPHLALRFGVGYFITDRIAASVIGRIAFSSGEGTLAGMLFGARGEYMLTAPKAKGLMLSAFAGATFGQIQIQPPSDGGSEGAPYAKSGLMGAHVGANVRYRFTKHFGVYAGPELDVQFPTFLFNVDLTLAGVEAAFVGM